MNVEFFAYGVPSGESIWGEEQEKGYFSTFYTTSDEDKFLIEVRNADSKIYCYYNYLLYKNIIANDGRQGSFFGITLRLDAYCTDPFTLYKIMDTTCHAYIRSTIFENIGDNLKYKIANFKEATKILEEARREIINLIKKAFTGDTFTSLKGFAVKNSGTPKVNMFDYSAADITKVIREKGSIAISPYFPRNVEATLKSKYENEINKINSQNNAMIGSKEQKINDLNNQFKQQQAKINELKTTINDLEQQLNKSGKAKKIEQLVDPIQKPLTDLAMTFRSMGLYKEEKNGTTSYGFAWWYNFVCGKILPVLSFLLLLATITTLQSLNQEKENPEVVTTGDDLEGEEGTEISHGEGHSGVITDTETLDSQEEVNVDNSDIDKVKIDIQGIHNNTLKKGKSYKVTLLNVEKFNNEGKLVGEGCDVETDGDPTHLVIKNIKGKTVKLKYIVNDKEKQRELTVN
jgi:hypothetical protein